MSNLPTPEEALRRFEAQPQLAAKFDSATRRERPNCKTHREAIVACIGDLASIKKKEAEVKALRAKVVAAKAKVARLERIKASRKTAPAKAAAPAPKASATPLLDQFNTMTGAQRTHFYNQNERAIRLEIMRSNSPETITPSN